MSFQFLLNRSLCLRKTTLIFHPALIATSARVASDKISSPPANIPPEYPPPTSKRDHVNFPRLSLRETPPPVKLFFFPESWFNFMYPKTGYTGPYILIFFSFIYTEKHELFSCLDNYPNYFNCAFFLWFLYYKFGDKIAAFYNNKLQEEIHEIDESQELEKEDIRQKINEIKKLQKIKSAIYEVTKARTEVILLQLENAFRQRLLNAYKQVKNKLDCQVELENVEKQVIVKNLMDYVMRNVMSSITPELEKNVLRKCISDLNSLASRA